jgi:hypothetical protein
MEEGRRVPAAMERRTAYAVWLLAGIFFVACAHQGSQLADARAREDGGLGCESVAAKQLLDRIEGGVGAVEQALTRIEQASTDRQRSDELKGLGTIQDEKLALVRQLGATTKDEPLCGALAERFQALRTRDARNVQRLDAVVARSAERLERAKDDYRAALTESAGRADGSADGSNDAAP